MACIDTVVIGASQAGLAASYCLTERGVDHVVLERWNSLRLLSPR